MEVLFIMFAVFLGVSGLVCLIVGLVDTEPEAVKISGFLIAACVIFGFSAEKYMSLKQAQINPPPLVVSVKNVVEEVSFWIEKKDSVWVVHITQGETNEEEQGETSQGEDTRARQQ